MSYRQTYIDETEPAKNYHAINTLLNLKLSPLLLLFCVTVGISPFLAFYVIPLVPPHSAPSASSLVLVGQVWTIYMELFCCKFASKVECDSLNLTGLFVRKIFKLFCVLSVIFFSMNVCVCRIHQVYKFRERKKIPKKRYIFACDTHCVTLIFLLHGAILNIEC